jgi:hypothetical protein
MSKERHHHGRVLRPIGLGLVMIMAPAAAQGGDRPAIGEPMELRLEAPRGVASYVIVGRDTALDTKYAARPDPDMSFHAYVERERAARRLETGNFNARGRATIPRMNATITYRIYYLCGGGEWGERVYQDVSFPDRPRRNFAVEIDADCA